MGAAAVPPGARPPWFWALLGVSVVSVALSAIVVSFYFHPQSGNENVVLRSSFVIGMTDGCLGFGPGYCTRMTFNLSGSPNDLRVTHSAVTFNESCPSSCSYQVNSDPLGNESYGYGFLVNQSASGEGLLRGGENWLVLWESHYCPVGQTDCSFAPVAATIEVDDLGLA